MNLTGVKDLIPVAVKRIYRTGEIGLHMLLEDSDCDLSMREIMNASATIERVRHHSLLHHLGLKQVYSLAETLESEGIQGDFVECGVYRGASAAMLGFAARRSKTRRHLWLFDSFQGLPAPTELDGPAAPPLEGAIVGDEANACRLLNEVGIPKERVHIYRGWFHETFPTAPVGKIALLHLDGDWYESIKLCLERFYDQCEPGAIILLDDYYDWPGCKAALDEFLTLRCIKVQLEGRPCLPPYFRKP